MRQARARTDCDPEDSGAPAASLQAVSDSPVGNRGAVAVPGEKRQRAPSAFLGSPRERICGPHGNSCARLRGPSSRQ